MKNFNFLSVLVSLTFIFYSCSTNETHLPEQESLDLLKSYTIQKDVSGKYLVDFILNDNVEIDNVKDLNTNSNEIYLYASNNESSRRVSQDLTFTDGSQIKVGFVDTNSDQKETISIEDDNSSLRRSGSDKLKGFSVSKESDGTYKLNYTLNDGFVQDLVFNEDEKEYEVHLDSGKSTETEFTIFLEKQLGQPLKICFINNKSNSNTSSKSSSSYRRPKTPVVIIDDDMD
jgi:hypothetical protein